ncbi:MAG: arginase [Boseongicola sp.]|nr:arginase [Boseongicola sp.]
MTRLGDMFGAGDVDTFMGVPKCRDLSRLRAPVAIIGADCATPYASAGAYCMGGPAAIRAGAADFAASRGHFNFDLGGVGWPEEAVVDAGDLEQDPEDASGNRSRIFGAVGQCLDKRAVPVLLGGDDSITIPALEAFGARGSYTLLQMDAHIDWRDEVAGERLGLSSVMRRASEMQHVDRIVQVGQRGLGSARDEEVRAAEAWGVEFVPGGEVARDGVSRGIDAVPKGADVIVAFDLDGLDPAIMPAVIGRTAGGLSYWQALELLAGVAAKARIAGIVVTEFMPTRDVDGLGAATAAQLLISTLGLISRQSPAHRAR